MLIRNHKKHRYISSVTIVSILALKTLVGKSVDVTTIYVTYQFVNALVCLIDICIQ